MKGPGCCVEVDSRRRKTRRSLDIVGRKKVPTIGI